MGEDGEGRSSLKMHGTCIFHTPSRTLTASSAALHARGGIEEPRQGAQLIYWWGGLSHCRNGWKDSRRTNIIWRLQTAEAAWAEMEHALPYVMSRSQVCKVPWKSFLTKTNHNVFGLVLKRSKINLWSIIQ